MEFCTCRRELFHYTNKSQALQSTKPQIPMRTLYVVDEMMPQQTTDVLNIIMMKIQQNMSPYKATQTFVCLSEISDRSMNTCDATGDRKEHCTHSTTIYYQPPHASNTFVQLKHIP
eukprot:661809_1